MFPFFESLCVKNGAILHLHWHELRFEYTYKTFYGTPPPYGLLDNLCVPKAFNKRRTKLKIAYNKTNKAVVFEDYKTIPIVSVQLVEADSLNYSFKMSDRSGLNDLFAKRGRCDDILIVKKGLVTDSSCANVIFFDGKQWLTPARPLLHGTCRARLIAQKEIVTAAIPATNLNHFLGFKLINAMRDMKQDLIPIDAILNVEC